MIWSAWKFPGKSHMQNISLLDLTQNIFKENLFPMGMCHWESSKIIKHYRQPQWYNSWRKQQTGQKRVKGMRYPLFQASSIQLLSCVRLCHPMDCSRPGFPVHHQPLELTQTHVHRVSDGQFFSQPLGGEFWQCVVHWRREWQTTSVFLPWEPHSEVVQSCLTLCDPMDCSLSGSSVHGILQARILEWVAMLSSRGSYQPRNRTLISSLQGNSLPLSHQGRPKVCPVVAKIWLF